MDEKTCEVIEVVQDVLEIAGLPELKEGCRE